MTAPVAIPYPKTRQRLPLAVKVLLTAFVAVLVPCYWSLYGPTNFLYFCDTALLLTLAAVWLESPLLASMPAVGILVPQTLWIADFLTAAAGGHLTGMTDYMFDAGKPLFTRGLSFFHFWLPLLLVWLVWRLGYDRRAFWGWTLLAWTLIVICFAFMPAPPPPTADPNLPVNINYVYGLSDDQAQTWMPPLAWVALEVVALPAVMFLPPHLLFRQFFPQARGQEPAPARSSTTAVISG